ncbi:hypothetical protein [Flavobacterium sp. HSC-61S13]|uniref:hypothetical protein n=1 Tax=Flavobacterium sp. HSC-61S13 TaxID=2910963 RepID=UPI00209DD5E8|nr:hypothetical protein [Flavobacterium sp. HSC-61S13]MCP1997306.1 hypothetical protein [Flavobacterium sp. HSC-61S13]
MNEKLAVDLGIITQNHPYKKNDGTVIFKRDLLTIWQQNTGKKTTEYKEITTALALKKIDSWN